MTEREHILWKHVSTDDLIIAMSSADDLIRQCFCKLACKSIDEAKRLWGECPT